MSKDFIHQSETWLPYRRDEVFAFFNRAENLQRITPPWLKFEVISPVPIDMQQGALIDYRLQLNGLPFKWQTEISNWQPPYRFTDSQLKGPYRKWVHTHTFEEKDGGTLMHDRVEYQLPGWFLAPLINRLFVKVRVKKIFAYRETQILRIFSSSASGLAGNASVGNSR